MFVGGVGGGAAAFTVKPTATAHVRRALGVVRSRVWGHHGDGRHVARFATLGRAPVCSDCHMNPHAGRRHRASGRFQSWHTIRPTNEAAPPSATYEPRHAPHAVLYQIVLDHLETFCAEAARARDGRGLPRFVEQEFRDFLGCGVLAGGFARFRCADCGLDRLVPFSCCPELKIIGSFSPESR